MAAFFVAGATVAALATPLALAMPAAASADDDYCNNIVSPYTDCADMGYGAGSYANGVWDINIAYYNGQGTVNVCEHTYIGYSTISDRCANTIAESDSDLCPYYDAGDGMSGHAGNDSANNHTIYGVAEGGNGSDGDPVVC